MYDWLPEALQERGTVITANRRLARALQQEFAARQVAAGVVAWETPGIYAWPDWLKAMLEVDGAQDGLPTRINQHQSALLWERCLRKELDDDVVSAAHVVRLARESYQRLADWGVGIRNVARAAQGRDQRAFASAAGRYIGLMEREDWVDEAGLAALLAERIGDGRIRPAGRFTFAGFDRDRPMVARLRQRLADAGCAIVDEAHREATAPQVAAFDTPEAELRAAGAWARQRLEGDSSSRIGIVVPGLERDAQRAAGLVREGLVPGYRLSREVPAGALNVSYGRRLSSYGLVSVGLLWLRWLVRDLRAVDVGHLLRSALIAAGGAAGRARLELRLRALPDRDWSPSMITSALQGKEEDAADWLQRVGALTKLRRELPASASPAEWALRIDAILEAAGWPGPDPLASEDFQLRNRWRDLLNDLARMDLVSGRMSLETALNQLESMATDAVFQPESEAGAVQLMGPLEASGAQFDAVWISGLTAAKWPPPGNPTPLISRRLQRERGMPDAEPSDTVAYARGLLLRMSCSAPEVVCSYSQIEDDAQQTPSDLLRELAPRVEVSQSDPGWHAAQLLPITDTTTVVEVVPRISPNERIAGGAGTIQRQLNNPMGAFVTGRLGVRNLQPQAVGLPASLRGNIIHEALYRLYRDKPTHHDLSAWNDETLSVRIEDAVESAFSRHERNADDVLNELLRIERLRVSALLRQFVAVDKERGEFSIVAVEEELPFAEGHVHLQLRVDRIDRLPDGAVLVLDYKTGGKKNLLDGQGMPKEIKLIA